MGKTETESFEARMLARLEALEGRVAALKGKPEAESDLSAARALVRDVIAEELERFWERRFGGRP